jgi:AraC-like DNA-binding protein
VEAAKRLLSSTTLSVAEITERIGYENVSTFVRLFRSEVGHSPARYRSLTRADGRGAESTA